MAQIVLAEVAKAVSEIGTEKKEKPNSISDFGKDDSKRRKTRCKSKHRAWQFSDECLFPGQAQIDAHRMHWHRSCVEQPQASINALCAAMKNRQPTVFKALFRKSRETRMCASRHLDAPPWNMQIIGSAPAGTRR